MGMIYKKMIKTASTTSTKEYSFEVAKSTIVGTIFDTRHRSNMVSKTLVCYFVLYQPFFYKKPKYNGYLQ